MRRSPIVVTVLSALACAGGATEEPRSNPPPPPREPDLVPAPSAILNPWDRERGTVYRGRDDTCFVELPFETPPTSVQAHPAEPVVCPPVLLDPSWEVCRYGEVSTTVDGVCSCFVSGNPPMQTTVPCPKHP